jgi:acyl-CoA oxidase
MQEYRQTLYEFLKDPIFIPRYELSMQDQRELTYQRLKKVLDARLISIMDYKTNLRKYLAFHDVMRMADLSLAVKLGVHMTLFGGTILNLGTEIHHKKWLHGIDNFEFSGCFGMTELGKHTHSHSLSGFILSFSHSLLKSPLSLDWLISGHGSNVQGIETEAIYDHSRREFIINTPHDRAQKYWIGNAACNTSHSSFKSEKES